jgi:hypothetical protein
MVLLISVSFYLYAAQIAASSVSIKVLMARATFFMIAAFAIWNVDNLMCAALRRIRTQMLPRILNPLLQFHAWWHILTMISGVHSLTAVVVAWCKMNPKVLTRNKVLWKLTKTCNGMIPWMTFEINEKSR